MRFLITSFFQFSCKFANSLFTLRHLAVLNAELKNLHFGAKDAIDVRTSGKRNPFILQGGTPMLVLSRKIGESIIIDGDITVTVVAVNGNKVRIGISAPPDVTVDREEVHVRRQEFADVELELVGCEG